MPVILSEAKDLAQAAVASAWDCGVQAPIVRSFAVCAAQDDALRVMHSS